MRKTIKRLCALALACAVTVGAALVLPLQAGAAAPDVTVNTTTIAFAGHEWVVIGDNSSGVATGKGGHVTLLQKNGDRGVSFGNGYFNRANDHNNYTTGELYTAMQGIYDGFGPVEQALVISRTLDDVAVDGSGTIGTVSEQKVWPLSKGEAHAVGNGTVLSYGDNWWLRSPGSHNNFAAFVFLNGNVSGDGYSVNLSYGIRPALILNLNSALFTSDAEGGKLSVAEGNWSSAGNLQTTEAIKLTLPDSSLAIASATVTGVSSNTIEFEYTANAAVGSSYNRLSAIVTDSTGETVKEYVMLTASPSVSGTASITVPDGLAATDKLLVFVEQVNDDTDLMSDFASAPVPLTRAAPAGLVGTPPGSFGGTDGKITGTTTEMEYSTDGTNWTACTDTETTGLAAGNYQVRYTGTVNGIQAIDSATATVTLGDGEPFAPPSSNAQTGGSPQTGDTSSLGLWVALAVLALAMLAGWLAWYKRRKKA